MKSSLRMASFLQIPPIPGSFRKENSCSMGGICPKHLPQRLTFHFSASADTAHGRYLRKMKEKETRIFKMGFRNAPWAVFAPPMAAHLQGTDVAVDKSCQPCRCWIREGQALRGTGTVYPLLCLGFQDCEARFLTPCSKEASHPHWDWL